TSSTAPAPTVTISADPVSISAGDSSTLSWTSTNADFVSIDNDLGTVDLNGSLSVEPTKNKDLHDHRPRPWWYSNRYCYSFFGRICLFRSGCRVAVEIREIFGDKVED
ncbi:hypothetical protein VU04_11960, partial [Desulfobulbus sp. TB]|nr:hypothetical protein [Desulfobulbus sp. TB]